MTEIVKQCERLGIITIAMTLLSLGLPFIF